MRELAPFSPGIESKLRGGDLVALAVRNVCHGDALAKRAVVMQHRTQRPVQFEVTQAIRDVLKAWIKLAGLVRRRPVPEPAARHTPPGHPRARAHPRALGR